MLLASAPRSIRAGWLGVSTLVLLVALTAPSLGRAQDGTVYIGGGSNASDGGRGVQGGDNVIVNMDAIDGGRGRARSAERGSQATRGDQPSVEFGEPYRGPAGAILRFPPQRPPQSQLVVDPEQLSDGRQTARQTQPAEPTPSGKPDRGQPSATQTTPAAKPDAPGPSRETGTTQSVEVPDAPSFDTGAPASAPGDRPEGAREGGSQPKSPDQTDLAAQDSGNAQAAGTESATAGSESDPMALVARPARKPQPPQATRTASQSAAPGAETGRSGADAPETTQTATSTPTSDDSAPDGDRDTGASEAGDQAAGDQPGGAGDAGSGDDGSGDDGAQTGDPAQTQSASLPPGGLPEQMRLRFSDGSATLTDEVKRRLDQLAQMLEDNPRQRVQLMAYAEGSEDTASEARRLSLSRALAVRTYLIDQGIRSTRMDVRALGATADQGPLDRVDIVPARR